MWKAPTPSRANVSAWIAPTPPEPPMTTRLRRRIDCSVGVTQPILRENARSEEKLAVIKERSMDTSAHLAQAEDYALLLMGGEKHRIKGALAAMHAALAA